MKFLIKIIILVGVFIIICIIVNNTMSYFQEKSEFSKLTGVKSFDITAKGRDINYFYIIANVSAEDKQTMLRKHSYKPLPVDQRGIIPVEFVPTPSTEYQYYLETTGHGYLGYVVFYISKSSNTVALYVSAAN